MRLWAGWLCACLAAVSATGAAQERLVLAPPQLWRAPLDQLPEGALSEAQIGWLAFGADALLEAGFSALETGLLFFGGGLVGLNNVGGDLDLLAVALVLLLHPVLDALLVDAVARVSGRFQPNFLVTLGGASLGCLLGIAGFGLAVLLLQTLPVAELIVASTLNALLPAAGAVLAEIWSKEPVDPPPAPATAGGRRPATAPGAAVPSNEIAWATAAAAPLARWTF